MAVITQPTLFETPDTSAGAPPLPLTSDDGRVSLVDGGHCWNLWFLGVACAAVSKVTHPDPAEVLSSWEQHLPTF